jgi:iron complex transport system ATP-binding protein
MDSKLARNLSVVLTEKYLQATWLFWAHLGRQPYTNWIGKLTELDVAKVNEAMELTQISDWPPKHYEISDGQLQKYWLQGLWLKIHHLSF